jgi:hypothetical protein
MPLFNSNLQTLLVCTVALAPLGAILTILHSSTIIDTILLLQQQNNKHTGTIPLHLFPTNHSNHDGDSTVDSSNPAAMHQYEHLDHDCFEPYPTPMMGTHDLSQIINVGMPKCGSNSLHQFFNQDFNSRHFHCGRVGFCGECMEKYIEANQPPIQNCGKFKVLTQMDYTTFSYCVFPQITYLEEIYKEAPNATFILPFRNVTGWIKSISEWVIPGDFTPTLRLRLNKSCDFTSIGIEQNSLLEDENMKKLYCNHVKHVRQFVHDHPSLTLIEFSIEDPNAGNILASHFPVDASNWGKNNANPKIN